MIKNKFFGRRMAAHLILETKVSKQLKVNWLTRSGKTKDKAF